MDVGKVIELPARVRVVKPEPSPVALATEHAASTPQPASVHGLDPAMVKRAVAKLNQLMAERTTGVRFSVDEAQHRLVVSVIDLETNKVLRQMPSEEALRLNEFLDRAQGVALDSIA